MIDIEETAARAIESPVAPPPEMAHVETLAGRHRRRRVASATTGVAMVAVAVAIGAAVISTRGNDRVKVATTSPTTTVSPSTTVASAPTTLDELVSRLKVDHDVVDEGTTAGIPVRDRGASAVRRRHPGECLRVPRPRGTGGGLRHDQPRRLRAEKRARLERQLARHDRRMDRSTALLRERSHHRPGAHGRRAAARVDDRRPRSDAQPRGTCRSNPRRLQRYRGHLDHRAVVQHWGNSDPRRRVAPANLDLRSRRSRRRRRRARRMAATVAGARPHGGAAAARSLRRRSGAHGARVFDTAVRVRCRRRSWPGPPSSRRCSGSHADASSLHCASTSRRSYRRWSRRASISRVGRSSTRISSGAACSSRSRRSAALGASAWIGRDKLHLAIADSAHFAFRSGAIAAYLVALIVVGVVWRDPGATKQVLVVPLSGALTALTAYRLAAPPSRRLSFRGFAIVGTAAIVIIVAIALVLPRSSAGTRAAADGRRGGSLLLIAGVDTSTGQGALFRLNPRTLGFTCSQTFYYSYRGLGLEEVRATRGARSAPGRRTRSPIRRVRSHSSRSGCARRSRSCPVR